MPDHPVRYWRDANSRADNPSFDTLDELIAVKEVQTLQFDDDAKQLEVLVEGGDDPVSNEPALNPDGSITVFK